MSLQDAYDLKSEDDLEEPKRKTPLWMVGAGATLLVTMVAVGVRQASGMAEAKAPEGPKTMASASLEGSSLAADLIGRRQQPPQPHAGGTAASPAPSAVPRAASAYIPPTPSVPALRFAGEGDCAKRPTLEARMRCLDEQFAFETHKVHLRSLGDSLSDEAHDVLMMDRGPKSSSGPTQSAAALELPRAVMGLGALPNAGFGQLGSSPLPARSTDSDPRLAFHATGGRDSNPEREVGAVRTPEGKFWLRSGSVVPCAFLSGVTSALPGQVEAQVTRNVYDSITHQHLLIPAGSMLVGRPNAQIVDGQDRIQFAWTELHLPDGEFRQLGGMAGADAGGFAGVRGKVNRHWGQKLGLALMSSSINVSFHLAAPQRGQGGAQDAVAQGVGEGVLQTVNQGLQKMMRIPDEIIVEAGRTCSVKVERSMSFPHAYPGAEQWRR